jgi:hypothetical protein
VPNWEYRVITVNTEYDVPFDGDLKDSPPSNEIIQSHLNEMGEEGWELVSFLPAPATHAGDEVRFENKWMYHAVFKRMGDDQHVSPERSTAQKPEWASEKQRSGKLPLPD